MQLAEEVRLGADPFVLDLRQLVVSRCDRLDHLARGEERMRRARRRLQLVRRHARARDLDLDRGLAHVRGDERVAGELADDGVVGAEAPLPQQPRQVLAAAEGRFVQSDRDDRELARERPTFSDHGRRLGCAGERALHVGRAASVDGVAVEPRRPVRDRHRVEVAVQDDRRPRPVAAQPGDDDRGGGKDLVENLHLHTELFEPARVEPRHVGRVARRALALDELQRQAAQPISVDAHTEIMTFPRAWPSPR